MPVMAINQDQLRAVYPYMRDAYKWAPAFSAAFDAFDITTKAGRAALLAVIGNETGGMTAANNPAGLRERMNYTPARAFALFPKARANPVDCADRCAAGEIAFGNWIYAGLYGNGDEGSGDGWNARGGGVIQATFKSLYLALTKGIGIDLWPNTDRIIQPDAATLSAAFFVARYKPQIMPLFNTGNEADFLAGAAMVGWTDATATQRRLDYYSAALHAIDGDAPIHGVFRRLLYQGCAPGDDVTDVEMKLADMGLYRGNIDRDYDTLTVAAVKAAQKRYWPDNPHEWDGVVGQKTWGRLFA